MDAEESGTSSQVSFFIISNSRSSFKDSLIIVIIRIWEYIFEEGLFMFLTLKLSFHFQTFPRLEEGR